MRGVAKLSEELKSSDNLVMQQALNSLCDVLRSPANISLATDSGVPESLIALTSHDLSSVRALATEVLLVLASHAVGRRSLLKVHAMAALVDRLGDTEEPHVRVLAHSVLSRCASQPDGAFRALELGLTATLTECAGRETSAEAATLALDTLHSCVRADPAPALAAGTLSTLKALLTHENAQVRAGAARDVAGICFSPEGKTQGVKLGMAEPLVALLTDVDAATRAAAAGAIAAAAITTEGKHAFVAASAPAALAASLAQNEQDERVLLAVTRSMAVLADAPAARAFFAESVTLLRELVDYRGDRLDPLAVSRNAQRAIDAITWRP